MVAVLVRREVVPFSKGLTAIVDEGSTDWNATFRLTRRSQAVD